MWLLKISTRLKLWWYKNYYTDEQFFEKQLAIAKILEPRLFKNYSINTACIFKLETLYSTIWIYSDKLKYIIKLLETKEDIPSNWIQFNYINTNVNNFLIDGNYSYINLVPGLIKFKSLYVRYCELVLESASNKSINRDYNLRILNGFNRHTSNLVIQLLEFTT